VIAVGDFIEKGLVTSEAAEGDPSEAFNT